MNVNNVQFKNLPASISYVSTYYIQIKGKPAQNNLVKFVSLTLKLVDSCTNETPSLVVEGTEKLTYSI